MMGDVQFSSQEMGEGNPETLISSIEDILDKMDVDGDSGVPDLKSLPRTPSPSGSVSTDPSITKAPSHPTKIPSPKRATHRLRQYLTDTGVADLKAKGRELTERLKALGKKVSTVKRKAERVVSPTEGSVAPKNGAPKKVKVSENTKSLEEKKPVDLPDPRIRRRPKLALRRPPPANLKRKKVAPPKSNESDGVEGPLALGYGSGSASDTTLVIPSADKIFKSQLKQDHRRREESLGVSLEEFKTALKEQTAEAIKEFKSVHKTIELNNYTKIKELLRGLSEVFGETDMQMGHIRWNYPESKNTKPLISKYHEICQRINVGLQERQEAADKMGLIEKKVEESYNKCTELLDVLDNENYAIDFQYGVAIHGEAYMKQHYDTPKDYQSPTNSAGIIPRLNHIQETLTDMIKKEPKFTAHSEWFYNDLLNKAVEKIRNEEAEQMTSEDSE
ncbi:hypothetical protein TWF281_009652 [Arthrobotrys megalospora]